MQLDLSKEKKFKCHITQNMFLIASNIFQKTCNAWEFSLKPTFTFKFQKEDCLKISESGYCFELKKKPITIHYRIMKVKGERFHTEWCKITSFDP